MLCYICSKDERSIAFVFCLGRQGKSVHDGCGAKGWLCADCSMQDPREIENAKRRWHEEHGCFLVRPHLFTAYTYFRRALEDLHCARIRLEQTRVAALRAMAGQASERIRPLEELAERVKHFDLTAGETG